MEDRSSRRMRLDSTAKLVAWKHLAIFLAPGDGLLHRVAFRGDRGELTDRIYPQPLQETAAPLVIGKREQTYIADCLDATQAPPSVLRVAQTGGNFSLLITPLIGGGRGIGFISVGLPE